MEEPNYFPVGIQSLLIDALLLPDADEARAAARQWLDRVDFDEIDPGSGRLLPLLHERLSALGIEHRLSGRIKGHYRRAWFMDQQLQHGIGTVLAQFARWNIPTVLLKGAALRLQVYKKGALRPSVDLDIMVRHEDYERAETLLLETGWAHHFFTYSALTFRKPDMPELDMHISPYHEAVCPHHVAGLWERAEPIIGPGPTELLALSPTDQLLHTLAHGLRVNDLPPIRWIVDAVLLLRRDELRVDWKLFEAEAKRLDLVEVAWRGLEAIRPYAGERIPGSVVEALCRRRTLAGRLDFRYSRHGGSALTMLFLARRNATGLGLVRLLEERYREHWGAASRRQLAAMTIKRLLHGSSFREHGPSSGAVPNRTGNARESLISADSSS